MKKILLGLLLSIGLSNWSYADVITLTNGHRIDCENLSIINSQAIIKHQNGTITLPAKTIAKVESGSLAEIQSKILTAPICGKH